MRDLAPLSWLLPSLDCAIIRLRPSGRGPGRAFIIMNQNQCHKLTELAILLAENAELIEKAIYLLFVMLN